MQGGKRDISFQMLSLDLQLRVNFLNFKLRLASTELFVLTLT